MQVIFLDAESLNLNIRMVFVDIEQPFLNEFPQVSPYNPFAILGNPYDMILVMVCPVPTQPYLHAQSIP